MMIQCLLSIGNRNKTAVTQPGSSSPSVPQCQLLHIGARQEEEERESDIEVLGPFPVEKVEQIAKLRPKMKANPRSLKNGTVEKTHPLFSKRSTSYPSHSESTHVAQKPDEGPHDPSSLNIPVLFPSPSSTTSAALEKLNSAKRKGKAKPVAKQQESEHSFPAYSYKEYTDPKPFVVYTCNESEADDLIAGIKPGPIAFDMEWKVNRVWGNERRTSVVQIADLDGMILIVQIHGMERFPKVLQALLEDPDIPKLGVNIMNDGKKLFRDFGITPKNLVELGAIVTVVDSTKVTSRKVISLSKLTEWYCSKILMKGSERTSDWESPLDRLQLDYATNDVHSTLSIYRFLLSLVKTTVPPREINLSSLGSDVTPYISPTLLKGMPLTLTTSNGAPMMRPQYMRAYSMWHEKSMTMEQMRSALKVPGAGGGEDGLKKGTVITYIISALQANRKLPFNVTKLRELIQMDGASWQRHREWFLMTWLQPTPNEIGTTVATTTTKEDTVVAQ